MDQEKFSLKGKIALITGASRGIGAAITRGFIDFGASVALVSRKLDSLEAFIDGLGVPGEVAVPFPAHVGKVDQLEALVEAVVKKFGRVDILVNNAGTNPVSGSALDFDEQAWDKVLDVNLKGTFFLSQLVARHMVKNKIPGSIINISSIRGFTPGSGLGLYSISKAGIVMATKVFANDLARHNIRVNCIAPGLIDTSFSDLLKSNQEALERSLSLIPMKRIAQPEEVVGAAVYLASDASSYTTGVTLTVDGGRLI